MKIYKMKKLIYFFALCVFIGCTATAAEDDDLPDEVSLEDNTIRIEVLTGEANYDELFITYYEYETDTYNWQPYVFNYNTQGEPEPVIINLENYDFRYVSGEVYRNNPSPASITLKIFVNDKIVIEETKTGDGSEYVLIPFNYDIKDQVSL